MSEKIRTLDAEQIARAKVDFEKNGFLLDNPVNQTSFDLWAYGTEVPTIDELTEKQEPMTGVGNGH